MDDEGGLREKIALACRILAHQGLVRDIIGHVSARAPGGGMFIRCRGDDEQGLAFTTGEQVRFLDFDGRGDGLGPSHVAPLELPIHGEILRARPEVGAVVHAHPEAAVLCGLAGIELRPIFGAFDPYATAIAVGGVPLFRHSSLISTSALAADLIAAMDGHDVCLLRGHGIVVTGATVEEATVRAIKLELLARTSWQLAAAGFEAPEPPMDEVAPFAAREGGIIPGGERWLWRHYAHAAETALPAARSPWAGQP